jgi:transposase-like protein
MIDASKGFIKDGNKNRLREQDIHRIVDIFTKQADAPRYARMVPLAEIADPKNDFNLNLPRYIDSTEPEDLQDIDGHLRGGIPEREAVDVEDDIRPALVAGAALYTDALQSYNGLDEFQHQIVDHAVQYVDGKVHTNGMENFWSLLKRGIGGTYVSVEPFHLFRYLDEQVYRFNNRKMTDAERFDVAVRGIVEKRLTFDQLTGKQPDYATCGN